MSDIMESNARAWNKLYYEVTYNRVKLCYKSEFALGVRILNAKYLSMNVGVNPGDPLYNANLNKFMEELKAGDPIFKYWIDFLINTIHYEQEMGYFANSYKQEQQIYENGVRRLRKIDNNIHWLLMLNMCIKTAVQQFQSYCGSHKTHYTIQWENYHDNIRSEIIGSIKNIIILLNNVLENIATHRDHLLRLNRNEQMWTKEIRAGFAEIQVWLDELVAIISDTCQLILDMQVYDHTCCGSEMEEIKITFERIINLILVVEHQPADVIKTEVNSPSTIRILLTLSNLCITTNDLNLAVSISSNEAFDDNTGKIKITRKIPFKEDKHDVYCNLKQLKVEKLCRRRQQESVIEQKYVLIYHLRVHLDNIYFIASAISWPLFVIVHHSQEPLAKAASMWDKCFSNIDRSQTKSVPWPEMSNAIKWLFYNVTKCHLNDRQLEGIYEKACRDNIIDGYGFNWAESCKTKISPNFKYTFWEWLYGTMKLTRDFIADLWNEGVIDGFISRTGMDKFSKCQPGSFLLLFSESILSGLIIMWIDKDKKKVCHAGPISSEMIKSRASEDPAYAVIVGIIRDVKQCTHLFNGIPKDIAFDKFYKEMHTKQTINKNSIYEIIMRPTFKATTIDDETPTKSALYQTLISTNTESSPPRLDLFKSSPNREITIDDSESSCDLMSITDGTDCSEYNPNDIPNSIQYGITT